MHHTDSSSSFGGLVLPSLGGFVRGGSLGLGLGGTLAKRLLIDDDFLFAFGGLNAGRRNLLLVRER